MEELQGGSEVPWLLPTSPSPSNFPLAEPAVGGICKIQPVLIRGPVIGAKEELGDWIWEQIDPGSAQEDMRKVTYLLIYVNKGKIQNILINIKVNLETVILIVDMKVKLSK